MKKILVPTDFSDQAENALKVAAQLAKKQDCEIYLLHILEIPMQEKDFVGSYSSTPEALFFMKLVHQKFEKLKSKPYLSGLTVHETVDFNDMFKGVFHVCKKHDIDLIVMGSNGASGFKEILVGSNTEKVVRTSEIPVLVVKNEHKLFKVDHFVFASDFKEESKSTYEKAIGFANTLGAKIHLLMVVTPAKFVTTAQANKKIETFAKSFKFSNYSTTVYNDLSIEKGIINFSESVNADLIGMSTHGRQGISHFFNGSISEDLVNHAKRPVITFKI